MRILCLTDRMHGAGRYSMEHPVLERVIAEMLPARGHSVLFWLHERAARWRSARVAWRDAEVRLLPSAGRVPGERLLNAGLRTAAIRRRLGGLIRAERIDLVHVRNDWVAACVGGPLLQRLGVPMVFQWSFPHPLVRLALIDEGLARWPRVARWQAGVEARRYRRAIDLATHVLPVSEWMEAELIRQGVPAAKMTAVPLGFDTDITPDPTQARAIRERYGLGDRPVVLYLGEMSRLRRVDVVIDAMADVVADVPAARLLMVGAGDRPDDVERLRRHAASRGLDESVVFTGYVPRSDVPGFIAAADVGVSPIPPIPLFWISSPTKFIEMLGMGCPVVANDIPEQRKLLEVSGGGIAVPFDGHAFGRAIVELLRNPETARAMGRRGRAFVEQARSLERIADVIENVYRSLVNGTGRERRVLADS